MKKFILLLIFLPFQIHARFGDLQNPAQVEAETEVVDNPFAPVKVCWGWGCVSSQEVRVPEASWNKLSALFSPKAATARDERKQIRLAIGAFEKITGELTGQTKYDLGAPNSKGQGKPGQTDCVDESINTTRYLKFLAAKGLIRFHQVDRIEMRFNKPWMPILGQHFTATIKETKSGQRFVVDGWWYDNGTPAVIQTLSAWGSRKSFDPKYVP